MVREISFTDPELREWFKNAFGDQVIPVLMPMTVLRGTEEHRKAMEHYEGLYHDLKKDVTLVWAK